MNISTTLIKPPVQDISTNLPIIEYRNSEFTSARAKISNRVRNLLKTATAPILSREDRKKVCITL